MNKSISRDKDVLLHQATIGEYLSLVILILVITAQFSLFIFLLEKNKNPQGVLPFSVGCLLPI